VLVFTTDHREKKRGKHFQIVGLKNASLSSSLCDLCGKKLATLLPETAKVLLCFFLTLGIERDMIK